MNRSVVLALGALALVVGVCVGGAGAATAAQPKPAPASKPAKSSTVVVKIDPGQLTIDQLAARYPIAVESTVLGSRGIYLVHSTDPKATDPGAPDRLAHQLAGTLGVVYAERNVEAALDTSGYHAWPDGARQDIGSNSSAWSNQGAVTTLQLAAVHQSANGTGSTVAILDTGADTGHPALSGRLVAGYDYIRDDDDASDTADHVDSDHDGDVDGAVGHGTFVAGIVALVAPQAKIMPMRVLDSDGVGNVFTIAQALEDAVARGAKVINLSFGTSVNVHSKVLTDAVADATRAGALIVAAAGNSNDGKNRYFPAGDPGVMSVGALATTDDQLASFSNFGDWVKLAAPGEQIVGPVPGGGYGRWSGTSMATPFVSGEAALVLGGSRLGTKQAGDAIQKATRKLLGKKVHFGQIDMLRALQQAKIA